MGIALREEIKSMPESLNWLTGWIIDNTGSITNVRVDERWKTISLVFLKSFLAYWLSVYERQFQDYRPVRIHREQVHSRIQKHRDKLTEHWLDAVSVAPVLAWQSAGTYRTINSRTSTTRHSTTAHCDSILLRAIQILLLTYKLNNKNKLLQYTGWTDVTESMIMIRSPFCGYNRT